MQKVISGGYAESSDDFICPLLGPFLKESVNQDLFIQEYDFSLSSSTNGFIIAAGVVRKSYTFLSKVIYGNNIWQF